MKKRLGIIILAILLCVVLVFTFAACKKKNNGNEGGDDTTTTSLAGVTADQVTSMEAKLQSYLNTWVTAHATEGAEDQKSLLLTDLNTQKAQFKLVGEKDSYPVTFNVKYQNGTYTVTASWGEGKVSKTASADAKTVTYANWAGKNSRTSDYEYVDTKTGVSDTLDEMVVAFVNSVNKVTGNAVTGKFGMDGVLGVEMLGANYGLRVKGNVDVTAKAAAADNELGLVIVDGSNKEIAGMYYKGAATAKDSRLYFQYNTKDDQGNEAVAYKYLEYADVAGWVKPLVASLLKDKAGKGVFSYTDDKGQPVEIEGLGDLLEANDVKMGSMISNIISMLAKAYVNEDDNRVLIDINLAEVMSKVTDIMSMLGDVDLGFVKNLGIDLGTMHGLFGHISISAKILDEEISDIEIAVNIPRDCTFYFTADESANAKKLKLPSIGFAIYLKDFKFLTTGKVANVVPQTAITNANAGKGYFSPTNVDLSGDVYINHVEGQEQGLNSTFHFEFVTDVNPLEILEKGYASEARGALVIKQHSGKVTYDKNAPAGWSNFLSISYEQASKLLCVSGTAFKLEDGGNTVYKLTINNDKEDEIPDTFDVVNDWLGLLPNWIGLDADDTYGVVVNNAKENGPAKESAQVIFEDKLVKHLLKYFMEKFMKEESGEGSAVEVAEASVMDEIGDYIDGVKALYNSLVEKGVIKFSSDPFTASIDVSKATVEEVIAAINKTFGTRIDAKDSKIAAFEILKVELNTEAYPSQLYIKVKYGDNTYELLFDDSKDKKFLITFTLTLKSNRTYKMVFDATSGIDTWTASVLFDIKNDQGAVENHTEVTLSSFHGEWGNNNVDEVNALLREIKGAASEGEIFPKDGTGPATQLAKGILSVLSSDKVFPVTSKIGEFIIRQVGDDIVKKFKK